MSESQILANVGRATHANFPSSPQRSSSSATPSRLVSLIPKLNFLRYDEETSDVIVKNFFSINMQILPNARRRDTRKRSSKNSETLFFSFCGFILFAIILISLLECSARVLNTLRTFFMLSRSSDDYQQAEYHVWKSLRGELSGFSWFAVSSSTSHRGNTESEVNTYASQHESEEVKVMSQVVERTRSPGWAAQRQGRRLYQFIMYTQLFQEITR